ncbi:hypothetical protein [Vibrio owensii]
MKPLNWSAPPSISLHPVSTSTRPERAMLTLNALSFEASYGVSSVDNW